MWQRVGCGQTVLLGIESARGVGQRVSGETGWVWPLVVGGTVIGYRR